MDSQTLTLQVGQLYPGQRFDHELRTPRGMLLLAPGETLTQDLLARLNRSGASFVLLTPPPAPTPSITIRPVQTASTLSLPEQSKAADRQSGPSRNTAFLPRSSDQSRKNQPASGSRSENTDSEDEQTPEEVQDRARRRAARRLWEFAQAQLRIRAALRHSAEEVVHSSQARWDRLPLTVPPVPQALHLRTRAPEQGLSGPLALELHAERAERITILQRAFDRLLDAQRVRATALCELIDELIDLLTRHGDRYAALALGIRRVDETIAEHAYATCCLSIAIAARLGWSAWDIRTAGLAGLLADSGMLLLASDLRDLPRPLTEIEWNALRRHPAYSVSLANHVLELPEAVGLAVYQHHERCDGSGYPRAIRSSAICDVAKVVAAADVLAAATSPRAHRPRLTPHAGVRQLVRLASLDQLDKAVVRAAVRAVGVYPAGSFVRLSSGELGLVEGLPDPERADRPVVRLVEPLAQGSALELKPEIVDLSHHAAARVMIVEALEMPDLAPEER